MAVGESIKKALPWIEPVLDYFDWKKRVVAIVAAIAIAGWSFVKGLAWPVIAVLAFAALVHAAYALVFPAILRMANVGIRERPNIEIWKHKRQFKLCEAACLLADAVPKYQEQYLDADSMAWLVLLVEAVQHGEIERVRSAEDDAKATYGNPPRYHPHLFTVLSREALISFCDARERRPEFLA